MAQKIASLVCFVEKWIVSKKIANFQFSLIDLLTTRPGDPYLAPIQMGDTGFSNGVLLSVVVAFTLLGVASDHAGLEAST